MDINGLIAKQRLKLPGIYYKPPKPDIPYAPELGAPMDFGLQSTMTPTLGGGPVLPGGGAPAPSGLDQQLGELSELLRRGGAMAPPVPYEPKPLTDSEKYIPAVIALLAGAAGSNDGGRTAEAAQGALGSFYGSVEEKNRREAERKTLEDQQRYFTERGQLGAETEIAKLGYERTAKREDDDRKFEQEKELLDQKGDQSLARENAIGERQAKVADIRGQVEMDKEKLKQGADPEKLLDDAFSKVLSGEWTQERFSTYAAAIKTGDVNKPAKTAADTALTEAKTQTENETRAAKVRDLQQSGNLKEWRAKEIERVLFEAPARFKMDLEKGAAAIEKSRQGGTGKASTAPQLRAALNSQISLLNQAIKEREKPTGTTAGDIFNSSRATELRAERDKLVEELKGVNSGQLSGKAPAP